eukprot:7024987-Prymnesium_polylepis.1
MSSAPAAIARASRKTWIDSSVAHRQRVSSAASLTPPVRQRWERTAPALLCQAPWHPGLHVADIS